MFSSLGLNIFVYVSTSVIGFIAIYLFVWKKLNTPIPLTYVYSSIIFIGEIILLCLFLGTIFKHLNSFSLSICILISSFTLFYFTINKYGLKTKEIKKLLLEVYKSVRSNLKPILIPLFIIIGLIVFSRLILLVSNDPVSWDDYHYHLGFVADIVKSEEIRYFDYTHNYTVSFPHNYELLSYYTISFFRNDFLVEIVNLQFLLLGIISSYLILRKLEVNETISKYTSFGIFSIPIVLVLIHSLKVDLAISCIFISLISIIINWDKTKSHGLQILTVAIGIGIIVGMKTSGFLYMIALIPLVIFSIKRLLNEKKWIKIILNKIVLLVPLIIFVFASFWFIRSFIVFGNPIYPMEVKVGSLILPGEWKNLSFTESTPGISGLNFIQRQYYVWMEKGDWFGIMYSVDSKITGTGPSWVILFLPSLLVCLILSFKNRLLFLILFTFGLIYLLIPGRWIPHYSIFLYFLGPISFGYVLQYLKSKILKIVFILLLLIMISLSGIVTLNELYPFVKSFSQLSTLSLNNISYWFSETNKYINENSNSNTIVAAGSNVYFPYSLYNKDYSNSFMFLPFSGDEEGWLNSLKQVKYILILDNSPESSVIFKYSNYFKEVVKEVIGPTRLYEINIK